MDPSTGFEWPLRFHADLRAIDLASGSDPKFPWELSTCRHLLTLGQADWLTGDQKYGREFVAQVESWIAANPPYKGINWTCPMAAAMRAISLAWAYCFFSDSPLLPDAFHVRFLNLMHCHGVYIGRNRENLGTVTNNHYVCNLLGLLYIGELFPILRKSRRWVSAAVNGLTRELQGQVNRDGSDFEASIPYHQFVTDMFFHAAYLIGTLHADAGAVTPAERRETAGRVLGENFLDRLEKMFEFILAYTRPDGLAPQIGDNDSGRLLHWRGDGYRENDHRNLLATAGEFFDRDDFRSVAGGSCEDSVWLFQGTAKPHPPRPYAPDSCAFSDAGIYVMRKGQDYLLVRCAQMGTGGKGGHTHNDNLSFELCADGVSYIVDPGTYTYTGNPRLRNLFRATAYHNSLLVDDREQNTFDDHELFGMRANSHPKVLHWETTPGGDVFVGRLAYASDSSFNSLAHTREIRFDKRNREWTVKDVVTGSGRHKLAWSFHAAPDTKVRIEDSKVCFVHDSGKQLLMTVDTPEPRDLRIVEGQYSPGYGTKVTAQVFEVTAQRQLPSTSTFRFTRR